MITERIVEKINNANIKPTNLKTFAAYNIVIDRIIKLTEQDIKEIEMLAPKSKLFEEILEKIYREQDTEIKITTLEDKKLIEEFIRNKKVETSWGGNAYHAFLFLKNFSYAHICKPKNIRTNVVLEYRSGMRIKNKIIKEDNRIILSDRTASLSFDCSSPQNYDYYFISGIHHITKQEELNKVMIILSKDAFKHVELSALTTNNKKLKNKIITAILNNATTTGMNRLELKDYLNIGNHNNIEKISTKVSKYNTILFLHEKDNIKVFVPKSIQIEQKDIKESVFFAQKIGMFKAIEDPTLSYLNEKISDFKISLKDVHTTYNEDEHVKTTKYHIVYVFPTLLTNTTKHVVGLGDTISAAFSFYLLYANVKYWKQRVFEHQ